jgi:hypothetical protein
LDAAVLIFVFPAVDSAIQFGKNAITSELMFWALGLTGVFFALAVIFGAVSERKTLELELAKDP